MTQQFGLHHDYLCQWQNFQILKLKYFVFDMNFSHLFFINSQQFQNFPKIPENLVPL